MSILGDIRAELKAPKNLYNRFGDYHYRNFETICEAVKPLLAKYGADLIVTDTVVNVGNANYIRATALLTKDGETIASCEGWAREQETKKGMDTAQISGATSSYARKYAVNGLFLIDDTKDPDSEEYKTTAENKAKKQTEEKDDDFEKIKSKPIGAARAVPFLKLLVEKGVNIEKLKEMCKVSDLSEVTEAQHRDIIKKLGEKS